MAICSTCGKKYSRWTAPVGAQGTCADCFSNEPAKEPGAEAQADRAKAELPLENRHGCLTTWLILMIIANAGTAISTPLMYRTIRQVAPDVSPASIALITLTGVANILFAIALFRWKKWGFFGFVASSFVALGINLFVGLGIVPSLLGLVGIGVLYWVLHLGGSNQAWRRLQ